MRSIRATFVCSCVSHELEHLPKSLAQRPALRALTLTVTEDGPNYIVPGRTGTYAVSHQGGHFYCSCVAASFDRACAHAIAARLYHERKYQVKIAPRRVEGTEVDYRQLVRLRSKGVYYGLFARYTMPKNYPGVNGGPDEEKFFVTFLVTHDAAGRQLPQFTEAFTGIRTKLFYNQEQGIMSSLVAFLGAMLAPKVSYAEIVGSSFDQPDLDELIAKPAKLFLKPGIKPNRKGIYVNQIDGNAGGFDPIEREMVPAIKAVWDLREISRFPDGTAYLDKPKPAFEDALAETQHFTPGQVLGEEDDEIPF